MINSLPHSALFEPF